MELIAHRRQGTPTALQPVEVVERKGTGHPDTICDALAEELCRALCKHYMERFGVILHHNVDKVLLCGGAARPAFGGGEFLEPIEIYLAGRAVTAYCGEPIDVAEIAIQSCRDWLRTHLPALDLARHVRIIPKLRPGSGDLTTLFSRSTANDTSVATGFAPFTPLERIVLEVERTLNSAETKRTWPGIGHDVKVMGIRSGSRIHLTIGCAMIGQHLTDVADYVRLKDVARELALSAARQFGKFELTAVVNAADDIDRGNIYLTVTGTSAESGDDGEAGRGNRISGLITPCRSMTMESAAGKNPVTHIGKLYNVAAMRIANRLVRDLTGVGGASCLLVSQIGRPIDDPQIVDVSLEIECEKDMQILAAPVRNIVSDELHGFQQLRTDLLAGRITLY